MVAPSLTHSHSPLTHYPFCPACQVLDNPALPCPAISSLPPPSPNCAVPHTLPYPFPYTPLSTSLPLSCPLRQVPISPPFIPNPNPTPPIFPVHLHVPNLPFLTPCLPQLLPNPPQRQSFTLSPLLSLSITRPPHPCIFYPSSHPLLPEPLSLLGCCFFPSRTHFVCPPCVQTPFIAFLIKYPSSSYPS